ncbi:hypothetical protein DCS_08118 [Drechmeria coniospora]|uniref:Uncharacterized protein n=1 Tax=Drechmeria coniospora TaxID=98403 RepID=A0A151GGJ0_DRECN|nr:hypothetical protein DCS_08118 [Drechmeria coniospora]KYK56151.1 hypothetical protein DCS_08118 [Drechmeria coniospora]
MRCSRVPQTVLRILRKPLCHGMTVMLPPDCALDLKRNEWEVLVGGNLCSSTHPPFLQECQANRRVEGDAVQRHGRDGRDSRDAVPLTHGRSNSMPAPIARYFGGLPADPCEELFILQAENLHQQRTAALDHLSLAPRAKAPGREVTARAGA